MIQRRKTTTVQAGKIIFGSDYPVVIQSMTKVSTCDIENCLKQIKKLANAGCHLVRVAVPTTKDAECFAKIVQQSPIPLVADIHFNPDLAIKAIEAGAVKIRLNPGNIKDPKDIAEVISCSKANNCAIRVGVNEASIRDLKHDTAADNRVDLMLEELKGYVRLFEKLKFRNIVLSAKSADTTRTIQINRKIAQTFDYPIHIGLTHAGLPDDAIIPSAVAVGTLLAEGIGDTVRISLAGDPVQEIKTAKMILKSLNLTDRNSPELVVCPTCGRCKIDVVKLAKKIRAGISKIRKPIRVAVMGCIVNGPGEAADADIAVCAAMGKGYLYKNGVKVAVVKEADLITTLLEEIGKL